MIENIVGRKTLASLWEERVSLYGDREFLVFEQKDGMIKRYRYDEFNVLVNRFAHGLMDLGIKKGNKVIVHQTNSPEFIVSWFALSKIGAVIVPTNIHSSGDELEYIINFSDACYIITEPKYMNLFQSILDRCKEIKHILIGKSNIFVNDKFYLTMEEVSSTDESNPVVDVGPDDINEMLFTSGTTSRPKGALLTNRGMVFQGYATGFQLWMNPKDRVLVTLPLFHVNAQLLSLVPTMTFGGTVILIEEYSASRFMDQLRRHQATFTCIVPTILRSLLKQPSSDLDRKHSLRSAFFALPLSSEEWNRFEERFRISLIDGYGLTETYALATGNPYWGLRKRHCVGIPSIGFEIKLIDDHGDMVLDDGVPGEILIRGNPIFRGYYKNEEETRKAIDEHGWLHTGDIGYRDSDGYFYFYDRKKDVIKRAGENVSASEVERVLNDHPQVLESAVVSVPDDFRDEAVFAFVVCENHLSVSIDDILSHCKEKLASFKVPQYIVLKESFKKTSVGKTMKQLYKDEALLMYKEMSK